MNLTPRTVLGVTRVGVGAVSLLAPRAAARVFGVDPERSNDWVTRLFGSRELALAATLLAAKGGQVRTVALLGAAIDGLDVLSSGVERGRGRLSTYSTITGGGGAVLFAALGVLAAREE